ncbi:MAG: hypothetical protein SFY68_13450 [Candidatus Sumerlaeia bacterium]|nr:hypothetical protein [Candidatus Sumerlaeia bacterium]
MTIRIEQVRQLVALYPDDTALRFTLGQKLVEEGSPESLAESLEHLEFVRQFDHRNAANALIYGKALIQLGREDEAREVIMEGLQKAYKLSDHGHDLIPALKELLESL